MSRTERLPGGRVRQGRRGLCQDMADNVVPQRGVGPDDLDQIFSGYAELKSHGKDIDHFLCIGSLQRILTAASCSPSRYYDAQREESAHKTS